MITFVLSPDVLGRTRFSISPLTEATMSLRVLGHRHPAPVHRRWLDDVRRGVGGAELDLLLAVVPQGAAIASCLVPPGRATRPSIDDQLATLAEVEPAHLRRDLEEVWPTGTMPPTVSALLDHGPDAAARLAQALQRYWDVALAPYWPRMSAVLEDDVSHRMAALVDDGLFGLLADLHPEISMSGHQLLVDKPHFADAEHDASEMTLTPSVFCWPHLVLEDGDRGRFGLTYPARGVARVWEGTAAAADTAEPLASLLGRTRASVLRHASVPVSTTHLAGELGQSAATVSEHLGVLREAGLVTSRRSGRRVLYRQTSLGEYVVRAQQDDAPALGRRATR